MTISIRKILSLTAASCFSGSLVGPLNEAFISELSLQLLY